MKYSEQLDIITEWEYFVSELVILNQDKNLIKTPNFSGKNIYNDYYGENTKEYNINIYKSEISTYQLTGNIVEFINEDYSRHWEWILDYYKFENKNTSLEFRGHIQKNLKKASELMVEAAQVICLKLNVKFPEIKKIGARTQLRNCLT